MNIRGKLRKFSARHTVPSERRHPAAHTVAELRDRGNEPLIINLEQASEASSAPALPIWSGEQLKISLFSLPAGGELAGEVHHESERMLFITEGSAEVTIFEDGAAGAVTDTAEDGYAIIVPRGAVLSIKSAGNEPLCGFEVRPRAQS